MTPMAGGHFDRGMRGRFGDVEIELHSSTALGPAARDASVRELVRLVSAFKYREPSARRVVLDVYARLQGLRSAAVLGDSFDFDTGSSRAQAIGAELMHAARAGTLVLRRREMRSVVIPIDASPDSEPLGPESAPTAWIVIELVDDDGNPVPNVDYKIKCDDGRVRTGTTNWEGKAREDGLNDGNCKVSFPGLNGPDWKKAG